MIKTDTTNAKTFFESSHKKVVINESRKELLSKIANKITDSYISGNGHLNINFICTHNSRRSQLGQAWAFFASKYFDLNITAFSGGTEVTAFYKNTVNTLRSVGFSFSIQEFSHQNPIYQISFEDTNDFILGFSKTFDHQINTSPYIAITTCDSADENCPFIPEAIHRFHLPYTDPKYADDTLEQDEAYLKTNREIASEIYYIFNQVKSSL